jgi:hypothetical protein
MDLSILATIGFTTAAAVGILLVAAASRKKR